MIKSSIALLCVAAVLATSACTGVSKRNAARADKNASKAQEQVAKERLALVEEYQKCVEKAGGSVASVEACDVYLRSAEALK